MKDMMNAYEKECGATFSPRATVTKQCSAEPSGPTKAPPGFKESNQFNNQIRQ